MKSSQKELFYHRHHNEIPVSSKNLEFLNQRPIALETKHGLPITQIDLIDTKLVLTKYKIENGRQVLEEVEYIDKAKSLEVYSQLQVLNRGLLQLLKQSSEEYANKFREARKIAKQIDEKNNFSLNEKLDGIEVEYLTYSDGLSHSITSVIKQVGDIEKQGCDLRELKEKLESLDWVVGGIDELKFDIQNIKNVSDYLKLLIR